jgi:TRAP-type C4-dicarboxylate transport system substrate-binding protein
MIISDGSGESASVFRSKGRMTMRKFTIIMTALVFVVAAGVSHAQTKIKIATLVPQNSGWATTFRDGSKEIGERTGGRVNLRFYWGGAQGNEKKILQKIKIGQLHGGTFSPTDFQGRYPDVNIYGLPFFFQNYDEVGYVRRHMDANLQAGFSSLGFETFGFAGGGFAYILSNQPVTSHADLIGKKVWLPQGDQISYEAMKSLQLSPVPLPLTDVLTGLQTGLIDIVAIPPIVALALQWHTKVKYVTRVPVLYSIGFMAIDKKAMNKISAADREILTEVLTRIYADFDAKSESEAQAATTALLNVGVKDVELDSGEFGKIRGEMDATNKMMAEKGMFSLELLAEMERHVAAFRSERSAGQERSAQPTGGAK